MREGSHASQFGIEGYLLHLLCIEVGVIIDTALGEEGDILQVIVVFHDMMKIGVTFTANVLERFNVEASLGRVLGTAFRVNLALSNDGLEPGETFVVMSDNELNVLRVLYGGRGSASR